MSTSNGIHHQTAIPPQTAEPLPDAHVHAAQQLADALAYDLDSLAFDMDLILPNAIPAIMKKLETIRLAVASIQRLMDGAAKPLQPVPVFRPKGRRRKAACVDSP